MGVCLIYLAWAASNRDHISAGPNQARRADTEPTEPDHTAPNQTVNIYINVENNIRVCMDKFNSAISRLQKLENDLSWIIHGSPSLIMIIKSLPC